MYAWSLLVFFKQEFSLPYLCDGCYNIMQKSTDFKNIAIVQVKKSAYRIYFLYMSKLEAKKLMNNSNLSDKQDILEKKIFFFFVIYKNE